MNNILCNITAIRTESVSAVISTTEFKLSLTDITTVPIGAVVINNGQVATVQSIVGDSIHVYIDAASSFSIAVNDIINIEATFRYSNNTIVVSNGDSDLMYDGRLSVNSINESFGSFLEKKQIVSNARINLTNTDSLLSHIYHSYELGKGAKISLSYGNGLNLNTYTTFFTGITNSNSNFVYDDTKFSFSAKDNRATLLETNIPPVRFNAKDFPKFATITSQIPIAIVSVDAIPGDWVVGMQIDTVSPATDGIATIVKMVGTDVYINNYSGTINVAETIQAIITASTAVVTAVNSAFTGISVLGDNGHFLGLADNKTPSIFDFTDTKIYSMNSYALSSFGGTTFWVPTSPSITKTLIVTTNGYIDKFSMNVTDSLNAIGTYLLISRNSNAPINIATPTFTSVGAQEHILSEKLQVWAGDTVHITVFSRTLLNDMRQSYHAFDDLKMNVLPRIAVGASPTEQILPVDMALVSGDGNIFFNSTQNVNLQLFVSNDGFVADSTSVPIIGSGSPVPKQSNGADITHVKFSIGMDFPTNFLDPVDLQAFYVSFPTSQLSGSSLDSGFSNRAVPLVYGDFSDNYLPAIKIRTELDSTIGALYSWANVTGITNALSYIVPTAADAIIKIGDSIEYVEAGGTETVYAKITQIIPTTGTTGTIYFEDFSIYPSTISAILVSRETNTYKVCSNSLTSIVDYKYLPKKSKEIIPMPTSNLTIIENLANGEFTLVGSNLSDQIFVACTGKSNTTGLIETPTSIIEDLLTYTSFNTASLLVDSVLQQSLDTFKLRRYITSDETFGSVLASIEANTNIHSYIDSNSNIKLIRFIDNMDYGKTYEDHNVVTDSFSEEYDPANIRVDDMTFLYNYEPYTKGFVDSIYLGSGPAINTLKMEWIWRAVDAEASSSQLFKVISKTPELIHVTLAADDILLNNVGEVIRLNYRGTHHIVFIYNIIKSPESSQAEIYGWNVANGYDVDFTIPDFAEFPAELQTGPYTYSPWLLNNVSFLDANGNFDVNTFSTEPNISTVGTVITNPSANTVTIGTGGYNAFVIKPKVGAVINVDFNISGVAGTVATCTAAQLPLITGNSTTDIGAGNCTYVGAAIGVSSIPVTLVEGEYILFYQKGLSTISDIAIYTTLDNNIADDRYNYWNPDWPYLNKKYYLKRHNIPGLPPSGLCVNVDGTSTDNITLFKGK